MPHATKLLRSAGYDNWSVRSCTNPTYVHDELARRVLASTGHIAILGEFVNVKLNGEYWGLYVLMDRPDARMAAQLHAEVFLKDGDPVVGDVHAWEDLISVCRDGDWADIDVGENIGARLQADQAEADTRVARATAEQRRAEAVATEQAMKAEVARNRSQLVLAEANIPKAMAEAIIPHPRSPPTDDLHLDEVPTFLS